MAEIKEFVASVKNNGLSRTNRYAVMFTNIPWAEGQLLRNTTMLCEQVQLPGTNFNTNETRTFGEIRKAPYERLYEDINMSFYVDKEMKNKIMFDYYEFPHENVKTYKILSGDKSDNIDGVKGCGLKTLQKRIPLLETATQLTIDELIKTAEAEKDKYKVLDTIVESKKIIERNFQLMQLENPDISGTTKLKILDRFNSNDEPMDKMQFIGLGMKYKILQNWTDVNGWLRDSFSNLILK